MDASTEQPPDDDPLDVARLLESSVPRREHPIGRYLVGGVLLAVLAFSLGRSGGSFGTLAAGLAILGGLTLVVSIGARTLRQHRGEAAVVRTVESLVQLRRWPEAAAVLQGLLARPMKMELTRARALVYLSGILSRYHRFDDAIRVQEHLLDSRLLDDQGMYAVRLGRAMAMLRADHLYDADRAIGELRKMVSRGSEARSRNAAAAESGALALVEMYRDVKTGHPTEALEIFDAAFPAMRQQLGHRLGDGCALAARAAQLAQDEERARRLWKDATLLVPPAELIRRYPEIEPLAIYPPMPPPPVLQPPDPAGER